MCFDMDGWTYMSLSLNGVFLGVQVTRDMCANVPPYHQGC